jgi:hypothetical protein
VKREEGEERAMRRSNGLEREKTGNVTPSPQAIPAQMSCSVSPPGWEAQLEAQLTMERKMEYSAFT